MKYSITIILFLILVKYLSILFSLTNLTIFANDWQYFSLRELKVKLIIKLILTGLLKYFSKIIEIFFKIFGSKKTTDWEKMFKK